MNHPQAQQAHHPLEMQVKLANGFRGQCEALYVSAQDAFLSEYTPAENNCRTWLTGFKGSTGDGIFFVEPKLAEASGAAFFLAVDGRYHLQVDQECPRHVVESAKVGQSAEIEGALRSKVASSVAQFGKGFRLGFDARRTSDSFAKTLETWSKELGFALIAYLENEPSSLMGLPGWSTHKPVQPVDTRHTGRRFDSTLKEIFQRARSSDWGAKLGVQPCLATTATDDAAFLLSARGYHLPFTSSILAYTFSVEGKCVVYLPSESKDAPWETAETHTGSQVVVVRGDLQSLSSILQQEGVTSVLYHSARTNSFVPNFLRKLLPGVVQIDGFSEIQKLRAQKTPEELEVFRSINIRSSRAISKTLRTAKQHPLELNELSLSHLLQKNYKEEGSVDLSFRTISGTGPNSAIVHYGSPQATNTLNAGEITLLDSGAYYDSGYATDCTRVIFNSPQGTREPSAWQKQIYTLTLKAFLVGMRSQFPREMTGKELDALVRDPLLRQGFNYAHGTGHGVGILVHEPGVKISPVADHPLPENSVVSMEPGIYLEGKGGVRIENVVRVKAHSSNPDLLEFENLIWVGFDWDLIDLSILDAGEQGWLKEYEARCLQLGTQVTTCPLLS